MKKKKIVIVILALIGTAMLISGIIFKSMHLGGANMDRTLILCGALELAGVAISVVVEAIKNRKKSAAGDGKEGAAKSASASEIGGVEFEIPPIPDDAEFFIEKDGKNFHKLFSKGEEVESVTLVGEEKLYTFDFLWYKHYGNCAFCVLGQDGTDDSGNEDYEKYLFRIVEGAGGETGLIRETDDTIIETVQKDFDAAVKAYSSSPAISVKYVDKGRKKTFIALTAIYFAVLAAGLIGFFTGFGIKDVQQNAICKAVTLAYAVITPSYLIYLGSNNPFEFNGAVSKVLVIVGIIAMVVLSCISMTTIPDNIEFTGFWSFFMNIFMPVLPFVATVVYAMAYCWWCKGAPSYTYLGFGIGVTVLFPVATALLIALFILYMIVIMIKWILSSLGVIAADTNLGKGFISGWTGKSFEKTYTVTDEYGYEHTVKSSDGIHFYGDGETYISDDGGSTIHKS